MANDARLTITVSRDLFDRIAESAKAEDRSPREQTRVLIRRGLESKPTVDAQ